MIKNTKNPICSEEILNQKMDLLIEIRNVSLEMGITPILGGSTLLGIMRDGDILPWGTGLAFNYKSEELDFVIYDIMRKLKKRGYKIRLYDKSFSKKLKVFTKNKFVLAELMSWYEHGEYRVRHKSKLPSFLFERFKEVYLREEKFTTFFEAEKYLEFRFANWKIPINSYDRSDYHSKDFFWDGLEKKIKQQESFENKK